VKSDGRGLAGRVAAVSLTAALIGCAQRSDAPPRVETLAQTPAGDSTGAALLGAFVGVLPCADCSGIRSKLRLYTEQSSGRPTRYEATETYLRTRDGDRTVRRAGRWTILRGSATDPNATVYQLDYDRADRQQNLLRVSDAELRLLDREQREITSTAPHSLHRAPNDQSVDSITLADGDSGRVARVARGQTVVIRLSSNRSTGYRWTLAPFPAGVLTPLGDPVYTSAGAPSGAVGAGGVEAWSFLASESGRQELRFEYRRPWERDVAAARILRYTIAVQ